jgi:hypothetical protein
VSDLGGGNYRAAIDNNAGNQAYTALAGAFGSLRWYVLATDGAGNTSNSGEQTVEIQYCPG